MSAGFEKADASSVNDEMLAEADLQAALFEAIAMASRPLSSSTTRTIR